MKKIKKETAYRIEYILKSKDSTPEETGRYKSSYREFDENQNVILDITYLEDESVDQKYVNEFEGVKLIDEKVYFGSDELSEHNSYEYDGDVLSNMIIHYQDGSRDNIRYEYDDNNNLLRKETRDEDDDIEELELRNYDNGLLISSKIFENGDLENPVREESVEYDEEGRIIQKVTYDHQEERNQKQVFDYDENGYENMIKTYVNGQLQQKAIFKRDELGRASQIIEEEPGQRVKVYQEFDDRGNVVKQQIYDKNEHELYNVHRKYDDNGNMTESLILKDEHGTGTPRMYKISVDLEYFE